MKKLIALLISVFFVNALFSAPVITAGITFNEFETAFNNDKVWYAQLQAGSTGTTGTNTHEFEFGGSSGIFTDNDPYHVGDFDWNLNSNHSFSVVVDSANNLTVGLPGVIVPEGNEYQITNPFNEIWVGLRLATGDELDDLSVNSHQYNGQNINDLTINDASINDFVAFKFYDDQETDNIAEFTVDGSLLIETIAERGKEEWTYTVFGISNTSIPEPSAFVFILGIIALTAVVSRRK